jgi:hypothetical protein
VVTRPRHSRGSIPSNGFSSVPSSRPVLEEALLLPPSRPVPPFLGEVFKGLLPPSLPHNPSHYFLRKRSKECLLLRPFLTIRPTISRGSIPPNASSSILPHDPACHFSRKHSKECFLLRTFLTTRPEPSGHSFECFFRSSSVPQDPSHHSIRRDPNPPLFSSYPLTHSCLADLLDTGWLEYVETTEGDSQNKPDNEQGITIPSPSGLPQQYSN